MNILSINVEGKKYSTQKHGQLSSTSTCIAMSLIDGNPTKTLLSCIDEFCICTTKQNVLQHGRIGEQDVWWTLAYHLTSIYHVAELHILQHIVALLMWIWLIEGIFATSNLLDTLTHFHCIIRSILLLRFLLWQVTIIYSICEICFSK